MSGKLLVSFHLPKFHLSTWSCFLYPTILIDLAHLCRVLAILNKVLDSHQDYTQYPPRYNDANIIITAAVVAITPVV